MGFSGGGGGGGGSAVIIGTNQGLAAARPAPGAVPAGTLYYATDTGEYSLNNLAQTAWQLLLATSAPVFKALAGDIAATGGTALGSQFYPTQKISNLSNGSIDIISAGLRLEAVGNGLSVKEGSNAKQGTAVLVGGTVTVANTSVTASSRIGPWNNAAGGAPGATNVSARTAGTSFTLLSTSGTDTSTIAYFITEPG